MSTSKQIKYGALISYFSIGISIFLGLLYTPWIIKVIGKEDYGLYTLSLSVISFFAFDFGLSSAVQRFIARYLARNEKQRVNDFLGVITKMYLSIDVFTFIVFAAVYFFIPTIYKELSPIEIEKFKIIYIISASYSVLSFPFIPLSGIISAHEKFIPLKLCDLGHKVLIPVIMIILLEMGFGLYALVSVNAAIGVLTIVAKLIVIAKTTEARPSFKNNTNENPRQIIAFSGWTTVIALSQRCIFNIVPTILGAFAGAAHIAVFGVSAALEGYVFLFANVINGLFLPKVTRIYNEGKSILPLMIKVGRLQLFAISWIFVGFILVGKDFVHLWLGEGFEDAYWATLLLIIPSYFALPQDIADQAILAENKVKYRAKVYIRMALLNLALSIPGAYFFGIIGVAVSIFISYMVRTIMMNFVYYKRLKIDVLVFFKETILKQSLSLIASYFLSALCILYIPVWGWLGLVIRGSIIIIVYVVISCCLYLNFEERKLVFGLVTSRNKK